MLVNPFTTSGSQPGRGTIKVASLPPSTTVLETLSYQYPLKLIAPASTKLAVLDHATSSRLVHTVFLLTYGGGLVAGDAVFLTISLDRNARLVLLTQGSTKIFKSPDVGIITRQNTASELAEDSILCYLPDPVQPFEASCFDQRQTYHLKSERSNLCVCDWVSEGRTARGEAWSFHTYTTRSEVWHGTTLLLRDNVVLDSAAVSNETIANRMGELGVFGTLIIFGPVFRGLGTFFLEEFQLLPRIGSRQWDSIDLEAQTPDQRRRATRILHETSGGVLWTVAETRGFVVVKFGAREVEAAKVWLRIMLVADGTVVRELGERALLCLR